MAPRARPSISSRPEQAPVNVATIGAAFSANKGAAAMLQGLIDRLPEVLGPCSVRVLTTYPAVDRTVELPEGVRLVPAHPAVLLLVDFPLAVLAYLLRLLGLPTRLACLSPSLRALDEAEIVVDLAGISFSDSRGVAILAYNILMTGVPLLLGKPVVKCSQALGPFRSRLNRTAARLVLSRVTRICARGSETAGNLRDLGLTRVVEAADLAFLMDVPDEAKRRAATLTVDVGTHYIAAAPSAVARMYSKGVGIDYVGIWRQLIEGMLAHGHKVVLFAHSSRPSAREGRMNDVPVCRAIYRDLSPTGGCLLLDHSEPPTVLRALIGGASLLVTSRFHAMISAMVTLTPVVVVGWSHKYGEVLSRAGLSDYVVPYESLSLPRLTRLCGDALSRSSEVKRAMAAARMANLESAQQNLDMIRDVLAASER